MLTRGLRVVAARIGLASNNPDLLAGREYLDPELQQAGPRIWSFLSALHGVEEVPFAGDLDGYIWAIDAEVDPPQVSVSIDRVVVTAPFGRLEAEVRERPSDRRYTLYGNAGLLSKYAYTLLEGRHRILSFHATAMYDQGRNELYIVVGTAGAGKTVLLLEGCLRRGYSVFATEMTHLGLDERGIVAYKGSLYDNIRLQTLRHDFRGAERQLGLESLATEGRGEAKLGVGFTAIETPRDVLVNPKLNLLFPHIEVAWPKPEVKDVARGGLLVRLLYENASEMICRPRIYYGCIPLSVIPYPDAERHRLGLVRRLVETATITQAKTILAGPRDCLAGVG